MRFINLQEMRDTMSNYLMMLSYFIGKLFYLIYFMRIFICFLYCFARYFYYWSNYLKYIFVGLIELIVRLFFYFHLQFVFIDFKLLNFEKKLLTWCFLSILLNYIAIFEIMLYLNLKFEIHLWYFSKVQIEKKPLIINFNLLFIINPIRLKRFM
jgi:hypothetical protein